MPRVALACVSQDAADAGARLAEEGGNAVDAALAASLAAVVTHPGMCSLGGGAFVTVWAEGEEPVTVDGGLEMPGRGLPTDRFGDGRIDVEFDYGGGLETTVGPGSVATPGLLAACARTAERFAELSWRALLQPAIDRVRGGFPLPRSCHDFLVHAYRPIYARDPRSREALGDGKGGLIAPRGTVAVEHLTGSLEALAEEGADVFYEGELGARLADHVQARGGLLTRADLAAYEPVERTPVAANLDGWRIATTPPPAVGGVALAAMLELCGRASDATGWTASREEGLERLIRLQEAILGHQRRCLMADEDREARARELLASARSGDDARIGGSSSTLHTSAVDEEGTACSVTLSDGYGSGVMPPGTGIWLNNCLGERELNPRGFHGLDPGTRLPSNMAPTTAHGPGGRVLAVGSPGAERIPTAILQVLLYHVRRGMTLDEAVEHPRLHVEPAADGLRVDCEPGLGLEEEADAGRRRPDGTVREIRRFSERSMYFGGVEAAAWSATGGFELSADSRRTGGTAIGGG